MGKANLTLNMVSIKDRTLWETSTDLEIQLGLSVASASFSTSPPSFLCFLLSLKFFKLGRLAFSLWHRPHFLSSAYW